MKYKLANYFIIQKPYFDNDTILKLIWLKVRINSYNLKNIF